MCWVCERSLRGGVWDRGAGSGRLSSGPLFGWAVGGRFDSGRLGSVRLGSGWLFGWAVDG